MKQIILMFSVLSISIGLSIFSIFNTENKFEQLKKHHSEKTYSYALDCVKEAEYKYWQCKAELIDEVQNYISSVAPTSNLRGYALVEECEKYGIDICFALAQGEIESHFGTKGLGAKINNVWNVGVFDGKTLSEIHNIYKNQNPNESIRPYLELLSTNYLVNKLEADLLENFVDVNGKRYATYPKYEEALRSKYNYIIENTKINEKLAMTHSYAIKCGW